MPERTYLQHKVRWNSFRPNSYRYNSLFRKKRSDLLRRSGLEGLTFRQILMQEDSEEAVALLSPILERLSIQAEKLKKVKGGTDRLIRIRMKQLEQRLSGAKQSDPHVYDKYV